VAFYLWQNSQSNCRNAAITQYLVRAALSLQANSVDALVVSEMPDWKKCDIRNMGLNEH
jgi:hypothetical protein